jgi:hypothetical protein
VRSKCRFGGRNGTLIRRILDRFGNDGRDRRVGFRRTDLRDGAPGVFTQNYTGDGNDTTFGSFTVQSTSTVDFSHPPNVVISDGMFTETFSAGILFGTSSGEGTASGVGTATFTADVVFTGGTGLFAGATGGATGLQMLMTTGPTTVSGSGTYVGTLSLVPEPSSLALLAPAALFVFYRRRRRAIAGLPRQRTRC